MKYPLMAVALACAFGLGVWMGLKAVRVERVEKPKRETVAVAPAASAPAVRPGETRLVIRQRARVSGSAPRTAPEMAPGPAPTSLPPTRATASARREPEERPAMPPMATGPVGAPEQMWQGRLAGEMEVEVRSPAGETLDIAVLPVRGDFRATLDDSGRLSVEGALSPGEAAVTLRRLPANPPRLALTVELTNDGWGGEVRYNFLRREHLALGLFLRHQAGETVGGIGLTLAF